MCIKLHKVTYHDNQAAGVDEAVIHVNEETVKAFRKLHHIYVTHGTVVPVHGLIGPALHEIIRFLHRHSRKILQRDISGIMLDNVLAHISVLVRLCEPETETTVTVHFHLNAFLKQPEIQFCLK